jgi:hypothetical protein
MARDDIAGDDMTRRDTAYSEGDASRIGRDDIVCTNITQEHSAASA